MTRKSLEHKKFTIVDLYSGCGGFGLGAELAGFSTVAAIDIDTVLQSAYTNNFPDTNVVNADLSKMNETDWKGIIGSTEIDGVIGGPPCQGYSRIGSGDINDPRRKLLEHFFRNVNLIKPKFFVMENVEGLLDKKNIAQFRKAINIADKKYTILEPILVDASEFGAPTKRRRVILVGFDESKMASLTEEDFMPTFERTSVADAILDLPNPIKQNKDPEDYGFSEYKKHIRLSKYAKAMRKSPKLGLGAKEAISKLKERQVSGCFNTIHSEKVKKRYSETKPGTTDPVSRSKKLDWQGFCPTLRAGTGSDKGSHQAVRPLHPDEGRVITVREAARLQGFPDWFTFHPTKWHSFRMIGNSVSPVLSKAILGQIHNKLLKSKLMKSA